MVPSGHTLGSTVICWSASTSTYRKEVLATPPFSSSVSIATDFIFATHCMFKSWSAATRVDREESARITTKGDIVPGIVLSR